MKGPLNYGWTFLYVACMKKILMKFFFNENGLLRPVVVAYGVNIFFLLICLLCGEKFFFSVSDDYFMARILEGGYGDSYNVHMAFVNVLYGYALLPLYYLFPKVGWYYVGEVFAIFISFTMLSYVLIKKTGLQWGTILSFLLIACFARDFYLTIQFTLCAAVLGAVGMALFLYSLSLSKSSIWVSLIAMVLMLWGFCMRSDAFLMGIPFFGIALLFFVKSAVANRYHFVVCILMVFCGLYAANYFNRIHYSTPEYQKYIEFQPYRVMLGDKDNYDKGAVYDEIEEMGLNSEDYTILQNWIFYDTETFVVDSLKRITDKILKYSNSLNLLAMPYQALYRFENSVVHPCCWAFCLISLVLLYLGRKSFFYVGGALGLMFTMTAYLVYLSRLVYRVESGLWLYATILAIPLLKEIRPIPRCRTIKILGILFVAYTLFFYFTSSMQRNPSRGRLMEVASRETALAHYKSIFDYMDSLPINTMFLTSMGVYQSFSSYRMPLYFSEPVGSWKRIVSLGFWTPYFPDVANSLKKYGIENPMRDVVKENVVVISSDENLLDYLRRHYYENAEVDTLRDIGGVKFFKYSTGL